jgi:DNA-binding LytR/AlgR family response regulator
MEFKKTKELKIEIETINIKGNNKEENISFVLDDLVYISSEGNYASFFIKSNNGIKERVLRNTLSNINKDLKDYKNIIRCHKSYIINSNYMDSISGNARGYFLESQTIPQQIPVSRKFKKENLKNLLN